MTNGLCGDWNGLCVSVSQCAQIGLSWVKEGLSAGGDCCCTAVCPPLCCQGSQHHTEQIKHKGINRAKMKILFYFVPNIMIETACFLLASLSSKSLHMYSSSPTILDSLKSLQFDCRSLRTFFTYLLHFYSLGHPEYFLHWCQELQKCPSTFQTVPLEALGQADVMFPAATREQKWSFLAAGGNSEPGSICWRHLIWNIGCKFITSQWMELEWNSHFTKHIKNTHLRGSGKWHENITITQMESVIE